MNRQRVLARQLCEVGRYLWQRRYASGTDSNLSVRLDNERVLCTPTLMSKGALRPADLCVVDMEGHQRAGRRRCTSEIRLHLAIYRAQPHAQAVVHCHSPHACAWAAVRKIPPAEIYPEVEVWLGPIVMAPYRLSGTKELADMVAPLVRHHYVILLANHGVVTWGSSIHDAYYRIEVLENYLETLAWAKLTGYRLQRLRKKDLQPLLALKQRLGLVDPRL